METRHPLILPSLPMKDMDGAMLTTALFEELSSLSAPEKAMIRDALALAAYLHRVDTRKSPTQASSGKRHQPSSPYIQHPLRNTLRLARWGVRDVPTLVASLLHDTVEDHAKDIVAEFTFSPAEVLLSEKETRKVAFKYIEDTFGAEVAMIVTLVSNPIVDMKTTSRDERNEIYLDHVGAAIYTNVKVFMVKVSDFVDNALGLHHFEDDKIVPKMATKYVRLPALFLGAWKHLHPEWLMSVEGAEDLKSRLEGAEEYLTQRLGV